MRHTSTFTHLTIFMVCCMTLFSVGFSQAQETPQGFPNPWEARAATLPRGTLDVDVVTVETDGNTTVTEFGASDTFTMALAEQPAAPIVLRYYYPSTTIILPKVVTFTPENWDVPQTLTVYAHHNYFNHVNSSYRQYYTAETVVDGIFDYTGFSLDFSISVVNTPKVIPSAPLVVTNLVDSVSEEIEGSLRQMLLIAKARAGADTITFQAGLTGTLTLAGDLPDIGDNPTIIGSGEDQLTIDGGGIYSGFSSDGITLESLTLTNMPTAVFGDMLLTDVTVTNSGGGASLAYGFPAVYGETITLNRVTMRGNSGVFGGAVASTKQLYITDSTFTDNHAVEVPFNGGTHVFGGGAVYIENEAEIEFSTFVDNKALLGGAIYLSKWSNGNRAFILDSRFHENSAGEGGAIFIDRGFAPITRSLFTANQAMDGGVIASSHDNTYAGINISNSTFNGNLNTSPTGAAAVVGSGYIFFSTFSGHHTSATNSTGVIRSEGSHPESLILFNVIIAHNNEANPLECTGPMAGDTNLTNDTGCVGHIGVATGIDPVLRDNGGFTQTHALLEGSNAIDADRVLLDEPSNTTGCIFLAYFSEFFGDTVDQRGNPRPVGRACDLGAVESEFVALVSNGSFETPASKLYEKAWQRKNLLANDKRLCQSDDPSLITAEGWCVFQFKANSTPTLARSLKQVITGGDLGGEGETLTLSAMVEGNKFKTGAKIVVTVTYANNTTAKKSIAIPNGTYAFQEITGKLKLTKKVKKIVVNINVGKVTGRLRVDEVWLSLSDTALHDFPVDGTREGAIQELPAAPDGFRR